MCVSTAIFCTLVSLAAKEGNQPSHPVLQEKPESETIAVARAIATPTATDNVTPEAYTVESASFQAETSESKLPLTSISETVSFPAAPIASLPTSNPTDQLSQTDTADASDASEVAAIAPPETLTPLESRPVPASATTEFSPTPEFSSAIVSAPTTAAIATTQTELTSSQGTDSAAESLDHTDEIPTQSEDLMASRAIATEPALTGSATTESGLDADSTLLFMPLSPQETTLLLAQATDTPTEADVQELQQELQTIGDRETQADAEFGDVYEGSPAITLAVPSGYGADNFEGFVNFSYQSRTRFSEQDDGTMGVGIGFGDAQESVGFQLSYTMASFGANRDFGTGGFNGKLHRQFSGGWSVAVGWEGFLNVGDDNDFEDSVYGTVTHIARLSPDLDDPFSRIALTAGVGTGRFRTEEDVFDGNDTVGVFGSMAVRIARPVSAIVEWTGQDLAMGLSIAPFRDFPLVITPAVRDITGAGDGARFVLGAGMSWHF